MKETATLIKALTHNIALCDYRSIEVILFGKVCSLKELVSLLEDSQP